MFASCGDATATPETPASQPKSDDGTARDPSLPTSKDESFAQIHAFSFGRLDGLLSSTAAFDDVGLRFIQHDLNVELSDLNVDTNVGEIDWDSEFVLMAVADACRPADASLTISVDEFRVVMEQGDWDCESLSPTADLFVVPLTVETSGGPITFAPDDLPELVGGEPIQPLPESQLGVFKPLVSYIEQPDREGDGPDEGAYFFDTGGDDVVALVNQIVGDADGLDDLQAQLDAVNPDDEFVLVISQAVCGDSFDLIPSEGGFTHTVFWDPAECESSPGHALVYVVPRLSDDGVEYTSENQPAISFDAVAK